MIQRIALLFLLTLPAFAADYTVTTDGKGDTYTLSEANQKLEPGDTAYLQPGNYSQRIEPARSGKDDAYILRNQFLAYGAISITLAIPINAVFWN